MSKFNPRIKIFSRVSEQDRILFVKHLALMAKSGISLAESVEVLIKQTKSDVFKDILQGILEDIENGQSLSKSLERYPKVFDAFYTNLIEVGEESGNLPKNLVFLAEQLERSRAFRGKIKNAMFYPVIVLSLAVVIGLGVSIFALPQLINIFQSFNVPLPLDTQILIFIATVMRDYGLLIAGSLLAFVVIIRTLIRVPRFRFVWHKLLLKIPVAGSIIANSQLALFCRNMGVMIQGGIPITTALEIQARSTDNLVYRNYVKGIREAVGKGQTIAAQLSEKDYAAIPPIVAKMVDVGEKSGKLDESLIYLGDFFEAQVDEMAQNISTIMEPILLFIIAGIVAFVALSIITPIYQLTGSITPSQ